MRSSKSACAPSPVCLWWRRRVLPPRPDQRRELVINLVSIIPHSLSFVNSLFLVGRWSSVRPVGLTRSCDAHFNDSLVGKGHFPVRFGGSTGSPQFPALVSNGGGILDQLGDGLSHWLVPCDDGVRTWDPDPGARGRGLVWRAGLMRSSPSLRLYYSIFGGSCQPRTSMCLIPRKPATCDSSQCIWFWTMRMSCRWK